ncbi:POT-type proton-dependent oligopeptide transporter [Stenotrophobium rhamnosiphilum]|uniref:MFS transporter n=1 Tax=Stenotrophobium rhamnosiphilum TaxID=2029166 RepID=A0A2T5MFF6_9GAMM|nr:oligopeptide:H+ symporter [Stenotrophobium rhamnosiphilum]PTU31318.1 hypothetical protein CJD38_08180 [Stenotrophobium rhamnosiphilum]
MTTATRSDKMPAGIPYIISNEFAERFCFYGVNAILVQYMIEFLHFGDAKAASWQAMFKSAAYFFPLLGAIVSDVFLAKFRTIISFSIVYIAGCTILALGTGEDMMIVGLLLMAFGTGGIKPCVSTNVGDQFTEQNAHLIERAFSYFYISINAGSVISIWLCPELLSNPAFGPKIAFGVPALMMTFATIAFWLGGRKFAVVPPAMRTGAGPALVVFSLIFAVMLAITGVVLVQTNKLWATATILSLLAGLIFVCLRPSIGNKLPEDLHAWLKRCFTGDSLKLIGRLLVLYIFVAFFWSLWDQSNGNSWTIQAQSALMDKHLLGFMSGVSGFESAAAWEMLPAQVQVVNGIFILILVPVFTFVIYPLLGKFFTVTPLRKIGMGLFTVAASFLIVAWIEQRIQEGHVVSMWWQISAYVVLTAAEVLVSITALEYSYKQAPLYMKSFVMSLFLLSVSVGNIFTAAVNDYMVEPLKTESVSTGEQTWVALSKVDGYVTGQKIDFNGENGVEVITADGSKGPLAGTFLIAEIDVAGNRVRLMDKVYRKPVSSNGNYDLSKGEVSTYTLVGPIYFLFFAALMALGAVLFIFVAMVSKERTFVREAEAT